MIFLHFPLFIMNHHHQSLTVVLQVERLNKEKQMEEVEIEIPASVYNNMQQVERDQRDQRDQGSVRSEFVRNCGKRNSLANKLKQLMIR